MENVKQEIFLYHGSCLLYTSIISANYFSIIAVVSMLVLTITGWDRFLPGFKVPTEKDGVHLRSQKERAAPVSYTHLWRW